MPGCCLIWIEEGDLAPGHAERVDLAPQLSREAQEHRPQPIGERPAAAWHRRVVNRA